MKARGEGQVRGRASAQLAADCQAGERDAAGNGDAATGGHATGLAAHLGIGGAGRGHAEESGANQNAVVKAGSDTEGGDELRHQREGAGGRNGRSRPPLHHCR